MARKPILVHSTLLPARHPCKVRNADDLPTDVLISLVSGAKPVLGPWVQWVPTEQITIRFERAEVFGRRVVRVHEQRIAGERACWWELLEEVCAGQRTTAKEEQCGAMKLESVRDRADVWLMSNGMRLAK